jgi:dipeptidyl aminopeptidase/acylaminoacyl peptidase
MCSPFRLAALGAVALPFVAASQTTTKRPITLDDLAKLKDVADPQCSPDGKWVVYTVASVDREADKRVTNLWMVTWDGKEQIQLTHDSESASSPRWSPDGKYISFVSSRAGKAKGAQVWVLDRRGGEAYQLTHFKNLGLTAHDWTPDSKHLLLVIKEKEEADSEDSKSAAHAPSKPPKPIVLDRYHFKQDIRRVSFRR